MRLEWFRGARARIWFAVLVMVQPAFADILVSNFAESERAATPIGNNPNPNEPPDMGPWYWAAQSFVTDSNTYALESIEVIAGEASDAPPPEIFAALYTDDSGTIGSFIGNFTVSTDLAGAHSARAFIPFDPITLDPDTKYWFVLGVYAPGDGTYYWYYSATDDFTGPGTLTGYADSAVSGTAWNYGVVQPYLTQVNVTLTIDSDGDGVDDPDDVCCNTPPGVLVDAQGRPVGDLDLDCDTDLNDAALFNQGFTGPLTDPGVCP